VAEELASRWDLARAKDRFRGRIRQGRAGGPTPDGGRPPSVAVLCPQTYMNDAGRSVGPARGSFKLPLERVLVVHDEIDLPFGALQLRMGGGLAGHNGLKSIKAHLHTDDFARIRIGVGKPPGRQQGADHVLRRMTKAQRVELDVAIVEAADAVETILTEGFDTAMNRFNTARPE
jgi:PTH1 family peptidyl-tRNA hydrolase